MGEKRNADLDDPKDLVREAFRIEGISEPECRSIFVDWALSQTQADPKAAIARLLQKHQDEPDDHPMKAVLREGLTTHVRPGRRGGRAARVHDA